MYYKNQLLLEGPNDPITFTDLLVIAMFPVVGFTLLFQSNMTTNP